MATRTVGHGSGAVNTPHRTIRRTGLGWWARQTAVSHEPVWETIARSATSDLQVCNGDRRCIITRRVTRMTGADWLDDSFVDVAQPDGAA